MASFADGSDIQGVLAADRSGAPRGARPLPGQGRRVRSRWRASPRTGRRPTTAIPIIPLRQGEIFGLTKNAVNHATGWVHVDCQVKVVNGHLVFSPPKRSKERDVPLPARVAHVLKRHSEEFPAVDVALPWLRPDGPLVTKRLLFSLAGGGTVRRTDFNTRVWKPALVTAEVLEGPKPGERHQAAREHGMHALRHFYASVLLDAGENVKALSTYLGHGDPGFTLRTYTHLMPSSEGRTRKALDGLYKASGSTSDGPQTAQGQ